MFVAGRKVGKKQYTFYSFNPVLAKVNYAEINLSRDGMFDPDFLPRKLSRSRTQNPKQFRAHESKSALQSTTTVHGKIKIVQQTPLHPVLTSCPIMSCVRCRYLILYKERVKVRYLLLIGF